MFGSDGKTKVWQTKGQALKPQCLTPTVKHVGGNVMVWGCMAASGLGKLHFIDGTMNSEMYVEILQSQMLPSARKLMGRRYIFQHENDPKNTAKKGLFDP